MKKSVKLSLRASEIRSETNKLEPGDKSLEKRRELMGQLETVETEYRAALTEEAKDEGGEHRGGDGLTKEEREKRGLESKAELRNVVASIINGREPAGAEAEFQRAMGLSGDMVPWEMVAPRMRTDPTEHRVDAATPAPGTSNVNQRDPLGRVFARSATRILGVPMPQVPTGDVNHPVLTAGNDASILAKDASIGDAGAGTIAAVTLSPKRIQAEYIIRREDRARLLGLEELLRADLSAACSDLLDKQVLAGPGTGANIGGFLATAANGGLPALANAGAEVDYATSLIELNRGVDGKYAGSTGELAVVVGDATYRKLGATVQAGSGMTSADTFMRATRAFMASANITAPTNAHNQQGIVAKLGAMGANSVCPVWSGLQLLVDEVSSDLRKAGQISLTYLFLVDFKILRKDGFSRVTFQVDS